MIRDMVGLVLAGLFLVLLITVIVALVSAPFVAFAGVSCADFGQQVGYPTKWSWRSGCYVRIDEQWVPQENFWQYVRFAPAEDTP